MRSSHRAAIIYLSQFGYGDGEKVVPLNLTVECTDLNDVIELLAWDIEMIELLLYVAQR